MIERSLSVCDDAAVHQTQCDAGRATRLGATAAAGPVGVRRGRRRRDERGLTTLEWLLIVAAVAGLAALAVVLVQNVVGDTSEQIAGSSARKTAATIAADQIMQDAIRNAKDQPSSAKNFGDWQRHYSSKCDRLEITYGDAGIVTESRFEYDPPSTGDLDDAVAAAAITTFPATGQPTSGTPAGDANGLVTGAVPDGDAYAHCVVRDAT